MSDNKATKLIHYYRKTEPPHSLLPSIHEELKDLDLLDDSHAVKSVETESCFNVQIEATGVDAVTLTAGEQEKLEWLLSETFDRDGLQLEKSLWNTETSNNGDTTWIVEFGPRLAFTSAFSSNAVSICASCGLEKITRLELSRRYRFVTSKTLSEKAVSVIKHMLHDKMTEEEYEKALTTFDNHVQPSPVKTIPIMEQGRAALEAINSSMGLGFDEFDLDYYTNLFKVRISCRICFL